MQSRPIAPVAFFAFRRPEHTRFALEALLENPEASETDLYVFVDGPRSLSDQPLVDEVVSIVEELRGFKSISTTRSTSNLGLSGSIISGVNRVLRERSSVIVVEDDIVTSPYFLKFMNDALCLYHDDHDVASIHGYCYPVATPLPDIFFLRGADCWGWATWTRAWEKFNPDGQALLEALQARGGIWEFDLNGSAPFSRLLKGQVKGRNDSWAIRWHASAYLANMFTLYPGQSLVKNIGIDGTGTHSGSRDLFLAPLTSRPIGVKRIPVVESAEARDAFAVYFRSIRDRRHLETVKFILQRIHAGVDARILSLRSAFGRNGPPNS